MKRVLLALAVLAWVLLSGMSLSAQSGQTHPVLVVNRSGKVVLQYQKWSDFVGKGKPTLLYFWVARYDECKDEAVLLQSVSQKYSGRGLSVVGISADGEIDLTMDAMTRLGLTYPQVIDMDEVLADEYGMGGLPYLVLLGPDGEIVAEDIQADAVEKTVEEHL